MMFIHSSRPMKMPCESYDDHGFLVENDSGQREWVQASALSQEEINEFRARHVKDVLRNRGRSNIRDPVKTIPEKVTPKTFRDCRGKLHLMTDSLDEHSKSKATYNYSNTEIVFKERDSVEEHEEDSIEIDYP